jgi:hypothetical protein
MIVQYQIPFENLLIDSILKLKNIDRGVKHSNVGGWHSTPFYNIPDWFESYFKIIEKTINNKIHDYWFNINEHGHSNKWHTHGNNFSFIGVWYLQTPDNSGNFCVEIDNKIETIVPYPELFITHPCGINHCVTENQSNQSRVSVAFNFCK